MKQTTIPMKENATLIVKTGADIMVEGIDQAVMTAIVDDGDTFRMKDEGDAIYLRADSDAKLLLPRSTNVTIENAGGDANLLRLDGRTVVQRVGGDLSLQELKDVSVDTTGGDCYLKEIRGLVDIHRVGGDLDGFRAVKVKALTVGGDIELSDISGAVELGAGGDVHMQFAGAEIEESHIRAGGDIGLEIMAETRAVLKMTSKGEKITVHACGQDLDVEERNYSLPLGSGGAVIELEAGGDIEVGEGKGSTSQFTFVFNDIGDSWKDFGKQIEDKIRQSMKGVSHILKQAGWQASEAMDRAAEKMRDFDMSKDSKVIGFSFDNSEKAPEKQEKKGVSDEERMMVLKMLQEKKISVEEAEKLLQALEK